MNERIKAINGREIVNVPKRFSLKETAWRLLAKLVSQERVFWWLYRHSKPYFDLYDKGSCYMHRVWLFNGRQHAYDHGDRRIPWLPCARIHHIMRPDLARDPHNHPWPARTIICRGWYLERRDEGLFVRLRGDTATLGAGEFHHITDVSPGGVWTLFIMWPWQNPWGFRTSQGFVGWREYLNIPEGEEG